MMMTKENLAMARMLTVLRLYQVVVLIQMIFLIVSANTVSGRVLLITMLTMPIAE